jgi:hypothetical protein
MKVAAAVLNWIRTRNRSTFRLRIGSFFVLLAFGWPMILPLLLSLIPDYIEFEFNSLPALILVWFPSGTMLAAGVCLLLVPWLRERRVAVPFVAVAAFFIVSGSLRVAYEHGADLTVRTMLTGSHAVPALLKVVAKETASTRITRRTNAARRDVLFLGHFGVPPLITGLNDSDWSVRASAAGLLAQMGERAAPAETALIKAVKDPNAQVRSYAADAVLRVAPTARFNVPVLIEIVNGSESVTRLNGVIALGDLGPQAVDAVPALTAALKDPYWAIRVNAANALGNIGQPAASAIPALNELLADTEPRVRASAATALELIKKR